MEENTPNKKEDALSDDKSVNETKAKKNQPYTTKQKVIITLAIVLILVAIAWVIYFIIDYIRGQKTYDNLSDDYTVSDTGKWYEMMNVDFARLKEINKDTRGWLFFENEDISYPIVQAADDDYYLNTSFEGAPLRAGSIFLEALNKGDFSDKNSIIYGHNMRDQSMFGKLQKYKFEENYYKDHLYFQVITPDRKYRFQIFSYNDVSETSDVYTITFATDREYVDFIRMVKQLSQANIDVPNVAEENATPDEQIIQNYKRLTTLSTCTSQDDMRFVVIGTLVGEYDTINKKLIYDSVEF